MNSREIVRRALDHKESNKLPVDLGSGPTTGIHVISVYKLRQYFGLDEPGTPVKVTEPYQMLGEVKDDLKKIIGVDVIGLEGKGTFLGFDKDNWKEWKMFDGTPVLVPGLFNIEKNDDDTIYQYVEGDKNYSPNVIMSKRGFYFNAINRQKKIKENELHPEDNLEEFKLISKNDLKFLKMEVGRLYDKTDYSIFGIVSLASSFGDQGQITGVLLKDPKGIRNIEDWYIFHYKRKDYIGKVFEGQCEIAIENFRRIFNVIGNRIDSIFVTGCDFGTQENLVFPKEIYRELYKPFHKKVNDWIHSNTDWKCFIHCDGAIFDLISDFIEVGFDVLNPIQVTARNMDPMKIKREFGKYLTFWGGGIDTQRILPFGTPREVKEETKKMIDIFSSDGGYVFSTIHNLQAGIPIENIISMIEVLQEYRR